MSDSNSARGSAVTVFTVPNCGQCAATKLSLAKHDIPFTEINLSANPDRFRRLKANGWMRAPLIETPTVEHGPVFVPTRFETLSTQTQRGHRAPNWPACCPPDYRAH